MLASTACALRTTPIVVADPEPPRAAFCDVAKPIYWHNDDTDETILQVREHNARYTELCTNE